MENKENIYINFISISLWAVLISNLHTPYMREREREIHKVIKIFYSYNFLHGMKRLISQMGEKHLYTWTAQRAYWMPILNLLQKC